jgi:hypothetical protein
MVALWFLVAAAPKNAEAQPKKMPKPWPHWNSYWISCPNVSLKSYGVYHFRNTFSLASKTTTTFLPTSADTLVIQSLNCLIEGSFSLMISTVSFSSSFSL